MCPFFYGINCRRASIVYNLNHFTMETEAWIVRTWDDLVFKNRNREYGAYSIRKAYSKRVMLGAGLTAALVAGTLVFTGIGKEVAKVVMPPIVKEPGGLIDLRDKPIINQPPKPPKNTTPNKSTRTNTTIQVVSN